VKDSILGEERSAEYLLYSLNLVAYRKEKEAADRKAALKTTPASPSSSTTTVISPENVPLSEEQYFPIVLPIYAKKLGLQEATMNLDLVLERVHSIYGGAKLEGDQIDRKAAALQFLNLYRQGEFGRWTLDL